MESSRALAALAALGQPTRLTAFRRLVAAAPDGLLAGQLAAELAIPGNTLSSGLAQLHRAGLVTRDRQGRTVRYRADVDGLGALIDFLAKDCCGGRPLTCRLTRDRDAG